MDNFQHTVGDGSHVTLSQEIYEKITDGLDLRKFVRDGEDDERQVRAQAAVLIIMYESYPLALSADDVWKRINEVPYNLMTDEEFRAYTISIVLSKRN